MSDRSEMTALVIGGGIAGLEAAITIAGAGHQVVLVEKSPQLGGTTRELYSSFPRWENPAELVQGKIEEVQKAGVQVRTGFEVISSQKQGDIYRVVLEGPGQKREELVADAVVVATGFELFDVSAYGEYGYGSYPGVVNTLEFESHLREWARGEGKEAPPKTVAFIKCVGSRDRSKGYPYCSKICCMITAKQAGLVKEIWPDAKCHVFYMDYRAAGKGYEEFVRSVIEEKHVRYTRGRPAKILPEDGRLLIRTEDTLMGVPVEIRADMVVLAAAMQPGRGTREMSRIFDLNTDYYGFLEPVSGQAARVGERVFAAGGCIFPVENQGALQQGAAAGAGVVALFNQAR
ncbi:MAG: FAD-dependent oxidoreductase [Syntrophomonadaceae bacterium]